MRLESGGRSRELCVFRSIELNGISLPTLLPMGFVFRLCDFYRLNACFLERSGLSACFLERSCNVRIDSAMGVVTVLPFGPSSTAICFPCCCQQYRMEPLFLLVHHSVFHRRNR